MACEVLTDISSWADFLVYPTTCDYFFWLKVLGTIFIILVWGLFKIEESKTGKGELISAFGVGSIAITIIATIGTLITNSAGIPMIQSDILLYIAGFTVAIILIWIFKE